MFADGRLEAVVRWASGTTEVKSLLTQFSEDPSSLSGAVFPRSNLGSPGVQKRRLWEVTGAKGVLEAVPTAQ